jgi:NAD(P)-dependent dehydrogenase (short-subunit alcohol dehydrogenase family)
MSEVWAFCRGRSRSTSRTREAKLLEEIRRGVQGLEQQLSDRFADAARQTRVNLRLAAALFVALVAGLSGLAVGVLVIVCRAACSAPPGRYHRLATRGGCEAMAANAWKGSTAIVTGAASGIGLALSKAMVSRGAEVWLTDVDAGGAKAAAEAIGAGAHAAELDVRDAVAVRETVDRVAERQGRIDYLFNNAGIGIAGESHCMGTEHFDRTVDINIRGVTNGIVAAYPRMIEQGHGHIVNTASAAGLLPVPLMTAYSMTKHAVVGLSESLRLEAQGHGVRVSVLCPTAVETPILDSEGPEDLTRPWRPNLRRYLETIGGAPYPVEDFAAYALAGIEANRGRIIAPASGRMGALLYRLLPRLVERRVRGALKTELADRP